MSYAIGLEVLRDASVSNGLGLLTCLLLNDHMRIVAAILLLLMSFVNLRAETAKRKPTEEPIAKQLEQKIDENLTVTTSSPTLPPISDLVKRMNAQDASSADGKLARTDFKKKNGTVETIIPKGKACCSGYDSYRERLCLDQKTVCDEKRKKGHYGCTPRGEVHMDFSEKGCRARVENIYLGCIQYLRCKDFDSQLKAENQQQPGQMGENPTLWRGIGFLL